MGDAICSPYLDDHSGFSIGLRACGNAQGETIKPHFIEAFEAYGLPWQINFDNGSPWGGKNQNRYTAFSIWLMRLGIHVSFSRPRHPQTKGAHSYWIILMPDS
jgi:transposase InsO family protein